MKAASIATAILVAISQFEPFSCMTLNESEEEGFEYIAYPIELTDQNFNETIPTSNFLVMFYWPTSGFSNDDMLKTMNLLSEIYNVDDNTSLKIASVDCEENNRTCADYGISLDVFESHVLQLFKINEINAITYSDDSTYLHYVLDFIKDNLDVPESDNSSAIELTVQNFKELTSNGIWFVDFYFPWCIHAKNLEPTWEKLATEMNQNTSVRVGKIDCVEYRKTICKEYKILYSPTLLWLENGMTVERHQGHRSVKLLTNYIEGKVVKNKSE